MRIRNRCLPPIYSIHQNDTAALTTNRFPPALPLSPETPPVVMVSSINGRISSKGDTVNEKKIDSTEPENGIIAQVNFSTQANQSCCEEEKVIPLKKRRISVERNLIPEKEKKINEIDVSEETKIEELRCRRTDGKKWRCGRRRVEGYSMCAHHLEREKLSRSSGCRRSRRRNGKKDENEDDKREKKIMKQVKARSINSLVRNTVPLMLPLNSVIGEY